MGEIQVNRRILAWGNGYGIRLTKADLERLGLRPHDEAEVVVRGERKGLDLAKVQFLRLGGGSKHHDEIIGAGLDEDL